LKKKGQKLNKTRSLHNQVAEARDLSTASVDNSASKAPIPAGQSLFAVSPKD
jgi:hypothetical protein